MKKRTATLLASNLEQLDQAPHVLTQLLDLLNGTFQPSPAHTHQLALHLAKCVPCQVLMEIALLAMSEHDDNQVAAHNLLTRWTRITHATLQEEIPAYVETLLVQGGQEANEPYPLLVEHMRLCPTCQEEADDLRSWLELAL